MVYKFLKLTALSLILFLVSLTFKILGKESLVFPLIPTALADVPGETPDVTADEGGSESCCNGAPGSTGDGEGDGDGCCCSF